MFKKLLCIMCLVAALSGCDSEHNDPEITFGEYTFAVIFENYGWSEQKKGFYINGEGELFTYNISNIGLDSILYKEELTQQQLRDYFEVLPVYEETIDTTLFDYQLALVNDAKLGELSEESFECFDSGHFFYYAFELNSETGNYRPILLYHTGDVRQENLSQSAIILKNWLIEKAERYQIAYRLVQGENNWCSGL
ncbi:hypothetical protein [Alteromonas facilis]|uniref:hypothetical protein n=1 Tax=Alteromonas facilis TaxID=2048004 RepID=UPI000C28C686|nr:hypothetical protein [Alteromonas facilis]